MNISETKQDRRIFSWASWFRICHKIRNQKYRSTILGVSGLALHPFRQKWGSWPSEWISGNSHQSAPHWALWLASYRYIPSRTIPCFMVKQEAKVIWQSLYQTPSPRHGAIRTPSNTMSHGPPRQDLDPFSRLCTAKPHRAICQTDWQTPASLIAIVCISCIRCSPIIKTIFSQKYVGHIRGMFQPKIV